MTVSKKNVQNNPLSVDSFIQFENKLDGKLPTELINLQKRTTCYISALKKTKSKIQLKNLSKDVWNLELGNNFILGRLGKQSKELPHSKRAKYSSKKIRPKLPKWSGITYNPKISAPRPIHTLRRVNGKKVIPHKVFGSDDRQVYVPTGYPWRCVGKIFAWTDPSVGPAWVGSGALVGPNVVLTASHVCPWGSNPWMMQFVPAFYDGASLLGSGVNSYVESYRGYRNYDQGDDMAVLKLYNPLGNNLGWFGSRTYHNSWEDGHYWTKCGYPAAVSLGQRPSRVTWFPIIDDDSNGAGRELEYKADASGGGSGGPVFGWWSDGFPYIVGTHVGWQEEWHFPFSIVDHNLAAGGSALVDLILWAHNNW